MITRLRAVAGALALSVLVPSIASAQPPRNPFAELFGRAPQRTGREYTALQFRTKAGAQIGQTLEQDFEQPDGVLPDGLAGGADGVLIGEYIRDRVELAGQGRYSYQEFRRAPAFGAPAFDAGGRFNVDATARLSFQGGGHFTRSPFFHLMWLAPDQSGPLTPIDRAAILLMQNDTVEASAGVTSNYTNRSSINLSATMRDTTFALSPEHDFSARGARGEWKRKLNRDLAFRAAYGREELRQQTDGIDTLFVNELLNVGFEYAHSLSIARHTSLSFATETSMIRENAGARHYRINGNIDLVKRFERTWEIQMGARRSTEFLPGFRAPVLTERGQASLAGYLAKRLILNVDADAGRGEVAFGDKRTFISYTGDAKLTVAVTRHFGFFTQYVYYHYQMPPDPSALANVPRLARQAVSVGVQSWLSLIDKEKVSRDPR